MLTNQIETHDFTTLSSEAEKIASKFLSKPIVEKIKIEGQEVNLLPKEIESKLLN